MIDSLLADQSLSVDVIRSAVSFVDALVDVSELSLELISEVVDARVVALCCFVSAGEVVF